MKEICVHQRSGYPVDCPHTQTSIICRQLSQQNCLRSKEESNFVVGQGYTFTVIPARKMNSRISWLETEHFNKCAMGHPVWVIIQFSFRQKSFDFIVSKCCFVYEQRRVFIL